LTESFVRVAKLKLQNTGYKLALTGNLAYITD
jgi:hypothetical protein